MLPASQIAINAPPASEVRKQSQASSSLTVPLPKLSPTVPLNSPNRSESIAGNVFTVNTSLDFHQLVNAGSPPSSSQSNNHKEELGEISPASLVILYYGSSFLSDIPIHPSPLLLQVAILPDNSITDFSSLTVCKNLVEVRSLY